MRIALTFMVSLFGFSSAALADHHGGMMESAMSAGPAEITENATIQDWEGNVLREGSNGWTCLPDNPESSGTDPWCVDAVWLGFIASLVAGEEPSYTSVGVAYMLAGDTPVDNEIVGMGGCMEGRDDTCVEGLGAHLMMLIPGENGLAGYSADFKAGGPWIMWPGTPYQHLMVPLEGSWD